MDHLILIGLILNLIGFILLAIGFHVRVTGKEDNLKKPVRIYYNDKPIIGFLGWVFIIFGYTFQIISILIN